MIIGRAIKQIVGLDVIEGVEHFGIIWETPGMQTEIEGHEILKGKYRVVGVIVASVTKRGKKKKKLDNVSEVV